MSNDDKGSKLRAAMMESHNAFESHRAIASKLLSGFTHELKAMLGASFTVNQGRVVDGVAGSYETEVTVTLGVGGGSYRNTIYCSDRDPAWVLSYGGPADWDGSEWLGDPIEVGLGDKDKVRAAAGAYIDAMTAYYMTYFEQWKVGEATRTATEG